MMLLSVAGPRMPKQIKPVLSNGPSRLSPVPHPVGGVVDMNRINDHANTF
jgi:hypothetical protein